MGAWKGGGEVDTSVEHQRRAQELRYVSGEGPFVAFDSTLARRLASMGGDSRKLADRLQGVYDLWGLNLKRGQENTHLVESCERICQHLRTSAQNINDLLELNVHMSIAKAAVRAPPMDQVDQTPWRIGTVEHVIRRNRICKPVITLVAGALSCEISKGHPMRRVNGVWQEVEDRLDDAGERLGLAKKGNSPDVVLTFWREDIDGSITVLGDAKRNASGDGKGYLAMSVEVGAVYAVSYRDVLDLEFAKDGHTAFSGPVLPAITLFARQLPETALLDPEFLTKRYRDLPPKDIGWLAAFDLERHMEKGEVISAWLGHLARQADAHLRRIQPHT